MTRRTRPLLLPICSLLAVTASHAQLSLSTVVDMALRASPRVKVAEADVARARAAISETRDAYLPTISAGAALGEGLGYSPNPPTLFQVQAQSLVYNAQQQFFLRSARAALQAASYTLGDVSESVAEDAATAYISFDHDSQRAAVFRQELALSQRLVTIVTERASAGLETPVDLTNAKLDAARLRRRILAADDDLDVVQLRLARIIGVPPSMVQVVSSFPTLPVTVEPDPPLGGPASLGVASAFANAESKRQQALGESRFLYRPQLSAFAQYQRYASFTDSFKQLELFENGGNPHGTTTIAPNEEAFGVQVTIPIFDKARQARAREALADAAHAQHDAENAQMQALDGLSRQHHTLEELQADQEIAQLELEQAQEQLKVVQIQLAGTGPGSPRDEQNARLHERDQYIHVLDATLEARRATLNLLRQTGHLEDWVRRSARTPEPVTPPPTVPSADTIVPMSITAAAPQQP